MGRLRLSITKGEPLRFLGHLDFLRAMERALRRSNLPLAYSEGFNPRMKVSYDTALGVGVTADPLYMDIELTEDIAKADVAAQLRPQLPGGIELRECHYVDPKARKLMAFINYEYYELTAPLINSYTNEELTAALTEFNARKEIPFRKVTPKKVRDIDARPIVPEAVTGRVEGEYIYLYFGLQLTQIGSIKPGELWKILVTEHGVPGAEDIFLCQRGEVYFRDEKGRLHSPFEEAVR